MRYSKRKRHLLILAQASSDLYPTVSDEDLEECVRYGRTMVQSQLLKTEIDIQAEAHMKEHTRILSPACAPHERTVRNSWNTHYLDDVDRNLCPLLKPMSTLWIGINQLTAATSSKRRRRLEISA